MQPYAWILSLALGAALAAPAMAEVSQGQMAVLGKIDALSEAKGRDLHEAALAACLAVGSNGKVAEMMFTEAGWTRGEGYGDDYTTVFLPSTGKVPLILLNAEAQTCAISSDELGSKDAHALAKPLLEAWAGEIITTTEGTGPEACVKYEAKVTMPAKGTVYLSVYDDTGEELSCAPSDKDSLTTFAFVPM